MEGFEELLAIARRKSEIDRNNAWYSGPHTYFDALKNEVDEAIEEMSKHRGAYLEDELGDVLWDYLNAVLALEKETGIKLESVLQRACRKYEERISGVECGIPWSVIKLRQKQALEQEHA